MKTVIMAGGRGTRMGTVSSEVPKPMLEIAGKPVLEHQLDCLRTQGFTDIIITISHLGSVIKNYFEEGKKWGVSIQYFEEPSPMGNAGALFKLRPFLSEDFLLLNADILFHVDLNRLVDYHYQKGGWATLFAYANNHPDDSGLIVTDDDNRVIRWFTKEDVRPQWYKNCANGGLHIISPVALDAAKKNLTQNNAQAGAGIGKVDLDRQVLKPLCKTGKIFCYKSPEYVQDMGTPERYARVCQDVIEGRIYSKNLRQPQRAVFLDRRIVMDYDLRDKDKMARTELLPGAAQAIGKMNEAGYLVVILDFQPAAGNMSSAPQELVELHNKMETLLGRKGAFVDQIYNYSSLPDKKYSHISSRTSGDCIVGLSQVLFQASRDLHIDLAQSWICGSEPIDIQTGEKAGCKPVYIAHGLKSQDRMAGSLEVAVKQIL